MSRPQFNRQVSEYRVVLMRDARGEWQPIRTPGYRGGYLVVCPNQHEANELVYYIGTRCSLRPPKGEVNDDYLAWLLRHHFRVQFYGRPKGTAEMLFAEFVKGWYPGEDLLRANRRSSPGITDGQIERGGITQQVPRSVVELSLY